MQRRRYFHSTHEEYQFPNVTPQSYLYLYKHNFPQIIIRFPSPLKTITGYRLYHAEIFYHPFYQQGNNDDLNRSSYNQFVNPARNNKIERLELQYQGEIILSLEEEIFNKYFEQEVLYLLKQQQSQARDNKKCIRKYNNKQRLQYSFHLGPNIYTQNSQYLTPLLQQPDQPSQIFKILLTQWLKDPQITTMSHLSQKHIKTFDSYDHGYIQLQILKTSNKTLKAPFHRYMKQRQWTEEEIRNYYKKYQNKIYYFQYQAYILPTYHQDFEDAQKLGFVMPNPITTNQFFYEVLLNMYNQFQADQQRKLDMKKRKEEKIRTREALLENLRKIGVEGNIPDFNDNEEEDDRNARQREDSFDKKLQELLSKKKQQKNQLKNISDMKIDPSHTEMHLSTIHNHNQSYLQTSPRRRVSTRLSEDQFKKEQELTKRYRSSTLANNVKIIRSFTSELLDDDFEQKTKRRFITKKQYVKLLEFNRGLMVKKKERQKRIVEEQNGIYQSPRKQTQQVVYVGLGEHESKSKTKSKKVHNQLPTTHRFAYDYFGAHQDTIIIQDQPQRKPMQYSWQQQQVDQSSFAVMNQYDDERVQQNQYIVKQLSAQEFKIEDSNNISAAYQRKQCSSINSSLMYRVEKRLDNGNVVYYARY